MREGEAGTTPAVERLRDHLRDEFARVARTEAHASNVGHRGVRFLAAGLAALIVLAGVGVVLIPGGEDVLPPTQRALAVTTTEGAVKVRVVDASADPEQMTAELRSAGIDGQVLSIPVSPNYVDEWVMVSAGDVTAGAREFDPNAQLDEHPKFLVIPKGASDITLIAGRPAEDGERVNVLPDGGTLPEPGGRDAAR